MSLSFVLDDTQARQRIDKVLHQFLPDTSRVTLQRWMAEGRVLVSGRPCRPSDLVGPGAVIWVDPGAPLPSEAAPDPSVVLDVLFEDAFLMVINKPAGLVVHPARGHWSGTLVNGLLARSSFSREALGSDAAALLRPGIVHRLDRDTSGVIMVAKTEAAREGLKSQLAARTVERLYRGITLGVPSNAIIRTLHARNPHSRLKFTSHAEVGKSAVTRVTVLEKLASGRAALIECRLETGRTHQIRVHLSEQSKTPLIADALYGRVSNDPQLAAIGTRLGRHALHAEVLGFVHPITHEALRFSVPFPADLAETLSALRAL
ncbi:MAG: RluA family pseudouridine synthase [Polyangiaceae bacterium]|nr:RluA family pseudouridine synthase [Polyangiaceae bacterium]